jgi:hypothetical protein
MVIRYKKKGGFLQLLQVIETCNFKKQENFLKMIQEESPVWADALQQKMLTFDKILNWPIEAVLEVMTAAKPLTFAISIFALDKVKQGDLLNRFSHSEKKKIETVLSEVNPTPAEIQASMIKVVSETRQLVTQGMIRLEKVDASLLVPDDIEYQLDKNSSGNESIASLSATSKDSDKNISEKSLDPLSSSNVNPADFDKLKLKLIQLAKENDSLKQENHSLKDKLERIRKIA